MQLFTTALLNTLIGMGTVFIVLIFISLIISFFKFVPEIEKKLKKREEKKDPKVSEEVPQIIRDVEEEEELVGDEELVAVITAAIMAYHAGTSSSKDRLVVRSIRRAKNTRRR